MITLLLLMALIGVIAWALTKYIPMPDGIKGVIIVAAIILCVVLLVQALGLDTSLRGLK